MAKKLITFLFCLSASCLAVINPTAVNVFGNYNTYGAQFVEIQGVHGVAGRLAVLSCSGQVSSSAPVVTDTAGNSWSQVDASFPNLADTSGETLQNARTTWHTILNSSSSSNFTVDVLAQYGSGGLGSLSVTHGSGTVTASASYFSMGMVGSFITIGQGGTDLGNYYTIDGYISPTQVTIVDQNGNHAYQGSTASGLTFAAGGYTNSGAPVCVMGIFSGNDTNFATVADVNPSCTQTGFNGCQSLAQDGLNNCSTSNSRTYDTANANELVYFFLIDDKGTSPTTSVNGISATLQGYQDNVGSGDTVHYYNRWSIFTALVPSASSGIHNSITQGSCANLWYQSVAFKSATSVSVSPVVVSTPTTGTYGTNFKVEFPGYFGFQFGDGNGTALGPWVLYQQGFYSLWDLKNDPSESYNFGPADTGPIQTQYGTPITPEIKQGGQPMTLTDSNNVRVCWNISGPAYPYGNKQFLYPDPTPPDTYSTITNYYCAYRHGVGSGTGGTKVYSKFLANNISGSPFTVSQPNLYHLVSWYNVDGTTPTNSNSCGSNFYPWTISPFNDIWQGPGDSNNKTFMLFSPTALSNGSPNPSEQLPPNTSCVSPGGSFAGPAGAVGQPSPGTVFHCDGFTGSACTGQTLVSGLIVKMNMLRSWAPDNTAGGICGYNSEGPGTNTYFLGLRKICSFASTVVPTAGALIFKDVNFWGDNGIVSETTAQPYVDEYRKAEDGSLTITGLTWGGYQGYWTIPSTTAVSFSNTSAYTLHSPAFCVTGWGSAAPSTILYNGSSKTLDTDYVAVTTDSVCGSSNLLIQALFDWNAGDSLAISAAPPVNGFPVLIKRAIIKNATIKGGSIAQSTCAFSNATLGLNGSVNGVQPFGSSQYNTSSSTSLNVEPTGHARFCYMDNDSGGGCGDDLWPHPSFGTTVGIPYYVVNSSQPLVQIALGIYSGESDPALSVGYAPLPPDGSIIEDGASCNPASADCHVILLDKDRCYEYDMNGATYSGGNWAAKQMSIWDLSSLNTRPYTWTSADASGLPIYPTLVKYEEVAAGVINHVVRGEFTAENASFIAPGSHYTTNFAQSAYPPMGMRWRLASTYDCTAVTPAQAKVICVAMQTYGLINQDNSGSGFFIDGVPNASWNDAGLVGGLNPIRLKNFEMLTNNGSNTPWTAYGPDGVETVSTVTVSGSTVTRSSGSNFVTGGGWNSKVMHLNVSNGEQCTISSVSSVNALTCSTSPGDQATPVQGFVQTNLDPPTGSGATATLSANPTSITSSQCSTLSWTAANTNLIIITPDNGVNGIAPQRGSSGSVQVCPTTTTIYTASVRNQYGAQDSTTATVTVH